MKGSSTASSSQDVTESHCASQVLALSEGDRVSLSCFGSWTGTGNFTSHLFACEAAQPLLGLVLGEGAECGVVWL